ALEQSAHRLALGEITKNFADNAALGLSETKWQGRLEWLVSSYCRPECSAQGIGCIFMLVCGLGFPGCLCCLWRIDKNFRQVNLESVSLRGLELPACAALLHVNLDQKQFVKA